MRKKGYFQFLNPRALIRRLGELGQDYSLGNYLKFIGVCFAGTAGLGLLLGLKWRYIAVLMAAFGLLAPGILISMYRNQYERKKFIDTGSYVEQLLFSFKRRSKILSSLEDTLTLFPTGELHEAIQHAIDHIHNANSDNIYREAFGIIEEKYGCRETRAAHDFLVKVEENGGEYLDSVEILIGERNRWAARIGEAQNQKQIIKRNMTLGVIFSVIIIASTVFMLPPELSIKENPISQTVTTIVMILNLILWTYVQRKLSGSLIVEAEEPKKSEFERYYKTAMAGPPRTRGGAIAGIVTALIGGFVFWRFRNLPVTVGILLMAYIIATQKKRSYRLSVKKITREIEKEFPDWMMGLALLLRTENVHVALSRSAEDASWLLRPELTRLLEGIERDPNAIEPYSSFFGQLDVPDIRSAMKTLFSMAEYGAADLRSQILSLIERNAKLMDKAERARTEDRLAGVSFTVLMPMLTGSGKMIVDMLLLVSSLLAMTNGAVVF